MGSSGKAAGKGANPSKREHADAVPGTDKPAKPPKKAAPKAATKPAKEGDPVQAKQPQEFSPTVGELDLHLFNEGRHRRLWQVLGGRRIQHEGVDGAAFAVWAPNARAVQVVGDFNGWNGEGYDLRALGGSGIWENFFPGVEEGAHYKYLILSAAGQWLQKADPLALRSEEPPKTASRVSGPTRHEWADSEWLAKRGSRDHLRSPMSTYEVHLGSWRRRRGEGDDPEAVDSSEEGRSLTYLELAEELPAYVAEMGFTHVELLPVAEHPFRGSWGYQVSSYFSPSARFGTPDDFRTLVDACHQAGLGVIVDWVPAHFPKDEWSLARFDGTALYEHADPRRGEHADWGTLTFNFGRHEVRSFLIANALFWMEEMHVDGLRVDAVASMLYLDYSRNPGEWVPNKYGGREDLEAIEFLKELNTVVYEEHADAMTIAEESTAWPGVSRPTYLGGLGFGFKWNMGWMHDTLDYFSRAPVHRRWHHDRLTFGLIYAWQENFVLPLSHDEVVHGKGSLLMKAPIDEWRRFANVRSLFGWMWAHPGKQLIFMGMEIAQVREWSHDRSVDWDLLEHHPHRGVQELVRELNRVYQEHPALWEADSSPDGFAWIDASDVDSNVLSFLRRGADGPASPDQVACVANLSPIPRSGYRVGLPFPGRWIEILNTDASEFGGAGVGNGGSVVAVDEPWHGQPASVELDLPPMGVLWLAPDVGEPLASAPE